MSVFGWPGFGLFVGGALIFLKIFLPTFATAKYESQNEQYVKNYAKFDTKKYKNTVFRKFLQNILTLVSLSLPIAIWSHISLSVMYDNKLSFIPLLIISALIMTVIGIIHSGGPMLQHLVLRLVLWWHGCVPWNYAKFLEYASDRFLLQRVGSGYRFPHKYLRDYFARMYRQNYTDNTRR